MRMTSAEYIAYVKRNAFKERYARLYVGTLQSPIREQSPITALDSDAPGKRKSKDRLARSSGPVARVHLVAFRHRLIDDKDNLIGGCKAIRDCVAASLGLDDSDKFIEWNYGQIQTRGQEGVMVTIESL